MLHHLFIDFLHFFQVINGVKETLCGGRRSHSIGDGTGGRNGHWRFSKDSSSNGTKKSHLDLSPGTSVNLVVAGPTDTKCDFFVPLLGESLKNLQLLFRPPVPSPIEWLRHPPQRVGIL